MREASADEISAIVRWRREHQPGGRNAGSIFTNPKGDAAGRLVEVAGCKGIAPWIGGGLGQARQLLHGRRRWQRRRRLRADRRGARTARRGPTPASAEHRGSLHRIRASDDDDAVRQARRPSEGEPRRTRAAPRSENVARACRGRRRLYVVVAIVLLDRSRGRFGALYLLHSSLFSARHVVITGNLCTPLRRRCWRRVDSAITHR